MKMMIASERTRLSVSLCRLSQQQIAKGVLFLCWSVAVCIIWLGSDGGGSNDGGRENESFWPMTVEQYILSNRSSSSSLDDLTLVTSENKESNPQIPNYHDSDNKHFYHPLNSYDNKLPLRTKARQSSLQELKELQTQMKMTRISLEQLPEALQPILNNTCCLPAILKDIITPPTDISCFGTCYNERACTDSSFPYSSRLEMQQFTPLLSYTITQQDKISLKERCLKKPMWLIPPTKWCRSESARPEYQSILISSDSTHIDDQVNGSAAIFDALPSANYSSSTNNTREDIYGNIPPPGCSLVSNGGGSGPWQHVFIFPKAKLAFCGIPKVGITQWVQFSRFVAGAKDYPSLPHYKLDNDFYRYDKLKPSLQDEIWQNETEWTWAVFLREPAERLLSAYLDKIEQGKFQEEIQNFLQKNQSFTFADFIHRLDMSYNESGCLLESGQSHKVSTGMTGLNWCSDPHWRPQVMSCGLSERLDRFQFVGDISNTANHTRTLLESVGLWESFGKHFIKGGVTVEGKTNLHMCKYKAHPYNSTIYRGFQQEEQEQYPTNTTTDAIANTAYGHSKDSRSKLDLYYTPELLRLVREKLYAEDFRLYQLIQEKKSMRNGMELAQQLTGKRCH